MGSPSGPPPGLAVCTEPEAGMEVQFCPIRGLPIVRSQRVRTVPGFHLMSLEAGRDALSEGSYKAYGETFPCQSLYYLHPEDKVFFCDTDHKAFLNQMSMQYHRYIRHELEERKGERKRLRERAAERQARSAAIAAQQARQQAEKEEIDEQEEEEKEEKEAAAEAADAEEGEGEEGEDGGEGREVPAAAVLPMRLTDVAEEEPEARAEAPADMDGEDSAVAAPAMALAGPTAEEDPYGTTMEDPYLLAEMAPLSAAESATAAAAARPPAAPVAPAAPSLTVGGLPFKAPPPGGSVPSRSWPVPAAKAPHVPMGAGPLTAAPAAPQPPAKRQEAFDEEDLYGDVEDDEPEGKRARTESTYASAVGAMLDGDFDEDE